MTTYVVFASHGRCPGYVICCRALRLTTYVVARCFAGPPGSLGFYHICCCRTKTCRAAGDSAFTTYVVDSGMPRRSSPRTTYVWPAGLAGGEELPGLWNYSPWFQPILPSTPRNESGAPAGAPETLILNLLILKQKRDQRSLDAHAPDLHLLLLLNLYLYLQS